MTTSNKTASFADLVKLGRASFDKAENAVKSWTMLIDGLVAAGYTADNTKPYSAKDLREGKVSNINKSMRDGLMTLGLATIKIKGKRLSDADLRKATDDEVSNKVVLAGTPKGTINGETTWRGNATSYISKIRKELEVRETDKAAGGNTRMPKTDADFIKDHLQAAYGRTFKADVKLSVDIEALQKEMRAVATVLGFKLNEPVRKG